MTWTPPDALQDGDQQAPFTPPDRLLGAGTPVTSHGFFENIAAQWQASSTGLAWRGKAPDIYADPEAPWYDRIGGDVTGLIGDAVPMMAGGFLGAAIPAPPPVKMLLTGAGAFVAPAVIRSALMDYYTTGQVDYKKLSVVAGKAAVTGAATFWAGGQVSRLLPAADTLLGGLGRQGAIGSAELTAMTGAQSVMDWRLPQPQEIFDNAVVIFGLRAAREYGVPALMRIYERTGVPPEQVTADAARNSDIAQEVLQGKIPEAYKPLDEPANDKQGTPREDASDLATHNLRHIGSEDEMRGEVESQGAEYLAQVEAARRGVVSKEDTLAAAEKETAWLAETIGSGKSTRETGTPVSDARIVGYARVIRGLMGQVRKESEIFEALRNRETPATTEEILAARVRYADAEAQLRAVMADYLGSAAELGRAMHAIQYIKEAVGDVKKLMDALGKAGGARGLDFRASMIKEMETNKQLASFVRRASTFDKVVDWWKSSIISGITTQMKNFLSNVGFAAIRVPKTFIQAMISEATGTEGTKYRQVVGEAVGMLIGIQKGIVDAGRVFTSDYFTNSQKSLETSKAEMPRPAITGTLGKALHTPFTVLEMMDSFAKAMAAYATKYGATSRNMSLAELLSPEAWGKHLTAEEMTSDTPLGKLMKESALEYTFQTQLSPSARKLIAAIYNTPGLKYIMPFALPFVRTPLNVYGEAVSMMPILGIATARLRSDWERGGTFREKAVATQLMGFGITLGVIAAVDAGVITGGGPADPIAKRALVERGWKEYSLRIGDKYYSYQYIEPFATLIGTVADLWGVKQYATRQEYDLAMRAAMYGFVNQVTNKTFIAGVASVLDLLQPTEVGGRNAAQAAGDILGGFIPNMLKDVDQLFDPNVRDARSFADRIINRIPVLRRSLLPKRDLFGEPLKPDSLFPFSGVRVTTEKNDPVRTELARLGYAPSVLNTEKVEVAPGALKAEVELSPSQLDSFRTQAGRLAHRVLEAVIVSPAYQRAPADYQRAIIEQVFARARSQVKYGVIGAEAIQQSISEAAQKAREEMASKSMGK